MFGLTIPKKQGEYVQYLVDISIDAIKDRIDTELKRNQDNLKDALGVGRRFAMMLPANYADGELLRGFVRLHRDALQLMVEHSLKRIPVEYHPAVREGFMIPETKPPERVHERGTPELQYRC